MSEKSNKTAEDKKADSDAVEESNGRVEDLERQLAEVEAERDEARAKSDEYLGMARRAKADSENYRKRCEKEREEYRLFANSGIVTKLLDILDDLDRALVSAKEGDPLSEGVAGVRKNLAKILEEEGLKEIPTDCKFDPNLHDAIMVEEGEDGGRIAEVYQKGYSMHGRAIRYAKVKVIKSPPKNAGQQ